MEKLLRSLERVRGYPEPVRRRFFWFSIAGSVFVIGAVWLVTLPWQLQNTRIETAVQDESGQPTLSETLGQGSAAVSDLARGALRDWLLKEAPKEDVVEVLEETIPTSQEALPRLPRAE